MAAVSLKKQNLEAGDTNEAARYHSTYRTVSPQQSPRGLLLGLEVADQTGDQDALGSYELALRNLYPDSAEHRAWMESHVLQSKVTCACAKSQGLDAVPCVPN